MAYLEQCVRGVLLEEGASGPLPPGSSCSHLRLHLGQWIKPDRDGATPGQQALQLLQVSIATAALREVDAQKDKRREVRDSLADALYNIQVRCQSKVLKRTHSLTYGF